MYIRRRFTWWLLDTREHFSSQKFGVHESHLAFFAIKFKTIRTNLSSYLWLTTKSIHTCNINEFNAFLPIIKGQYLRNVVSVYILHTIYIYIY